MPRAWVAIGSNLGEREAHLEFALRELERSFPVHLLRRSSWIETEPEGGPTGQGRFLNGVVELDTTLTPRALLEALLAIERAAGRVRTVRNAPRTLDLDLLLYDELWIDDGDLVVPHPRMEERTFVLEPFAELAPDLALPRSGKTVRQRLAELRARATDQG